jgi:hypothetical protein
MNTLLLFAATFVLVFGLGIQQLNVTADMAAAAFFTSIVISSANLVLFKVLPGPITWPEIVGYTLGGSCGIVASMRAHPWLVRRWGRRS